MSSAQQGSSIECVHCKKCFQTISSRNRHLRNIHHDNSANSSKRSRIICPSCSPSANAYFSSFDLLKKHICSTHNLLIETNEYQFNCEEDFKTWKENVEKESKSFYLLNSTAESTSGKVFYYECHRSNLGNFESKCNARAPKVSGSIKIKGVCPSRMRAEFYHNSSKVSVKYTTPHVGHKEELRCQPLSTTEKKWIINQIKIGVSYENIIKNARHIEKDECSRLNLLTTKDICYLADANNLSNHRNKLDIIAVEMKVAEWNSNGKNTVFLFKKPGENHNKLHLDDFALAIMTTEMEYMLKTYGKQIICMDGTHATNPYDYELTTILVLDYQNIGYPVVFLLSNRRDTIIQEVLLTELKKFIGPLIPDYFMTDDTAIYWNAWNNIMGQLPKRLLCTWHIKKNWIIQSRAKISDHDIRKKVQRDLDQILKETEETEFFRLKEQLFKYLELTSQNVFLQYLKSYYFQDAEREASWAHCYRKHAGINTSMHLEAFHRTLKYNYFSGKTVRRLEICLDTLDKLLKDKSWKRIASILRPIATHHDHIVNKAHRLAMTMGFDAVAEENSKLFLVHSQTRIDFYKVEILDNECGCRTMRCPICDTCVHKLKCSCYEATIKNNFCKHMHLVAMYLKREQIATHPETESNTSGTDGSDGQLVIALPSTSQEILSEEVNLQILNNCDKKEPDDYTEKQEQCKNLLYSIFEKCKSSSDYDLLMKKLIEIKGDFHNPQLSATISAAPARSRKFSKQTFFPSKKLKTQSDC